MSERHCGGCIYWHGKIDVEIGECHEGTPIMLGMIANLEERSVDQTAQILWGWPKCHRSDWCGKWREEKDESKKYPATVGLAPGLEPW